MWEFDCDNYDPKKMEGYNNALPGRYHFEVTNCEEEGGKNGEMIVDMEVLGGTTPDQEGATHREYFTHSANAEGRALQFAVATRLTTVEELKAMKEARQNPRFEFEMAIGRQFCGELQEEEYEGKRRCKLGFRMWALDAPGAKGIPLNKGAMLRDGGDDPFGNPVPSPTPPAALPPSPPNANPFDEIPF